MANNFYFIDDTVTAGQNTIVSVENEAATFGIGATTYLNVTTISDSKGSLRDIPINTQSSSASYTLVDSDAGKVVHAHTTTATVVVPNSVFSVGNVVTILNGGTGNITISQGTGFSLRNSGDGTTGNRTLAQYGMATIYFATAGIGYISGSNMT
tara:strand:- start:242 stop:703 length:462 start_codon:yes stop_codon:yes gene_type:complete